MGSKEFLNICKAKVADYFNQNKDKTDTSDNMTVDDVFVVWYCKTLQNHKALLSTPVSDGMYYEITYSEIRMKSTLMLIKSGKTLNLICNCATSHGRR